MYCTLNKTIKCQFKKASIYVLALFLIVTNIGLSAYEEETNCLSPATEQAVRKFEKIGHELGIHGSYISEFLLNCSYVQDAWLTFLHDAEDIHAYHRGMDYLQPYTKSFHSICSYTSSIINFYTGDHNYPTPQFVKTEFDGQISNGFLNTFKTGRFLSEEEREFLFNLEMTKFQKDKVTEPFLLNQNTIQNLESEMLYNFVLLPDGSIFAAYERPGNKEYHVGDDEGVEEAFQYPNHTILAGSPHQVVVTAGAFVLHEIDGKRLFFISCKSGHFQPTYLSLSKMQDQLVKLGVHRSTIIAAPDVDLSVVVLKLYNIAKIPVSLTIEDNERLFNLADNKWKKCYTSIDKSLIQGLANGEAVELTPELIETLNKQREEATYMRTAFNLFTQDHRVPRNFHKLVKGFGKLKDAIKHNARNKIQETASKMLELLEMYEAELDSYTINPSTDDSFYAYITDMQTKLDAFLEQSHLEVHNYHHVKKYSRDLATLFMYLSEDAKWRKKGYFIYRTASKAFFEINEQMAKEHDAYIGKLLHGKIDQEDTVEIEMSQKITEQLRWYLDHLGIAPPKISLEVKPEAAWWMINWSKDWYGSHAETLSKEAKDQSVRKMLRSLVKNQFSEMIPDGHALANLKALRRDVHVAASALLFLDASHSIPKKVMNYHAALDHVIKGIEKNRVSTIIEDSKFLLQQSQNGVPTNALEQWTCTDQESFDEILLCCVQHFSPIIDNTVMSIQEAQEMQNSIQMLQDLLYLYRRNGIKKRTNDLPCVCYDILEERAESLCFSIQKAVESQEGRGKCIVITPEMKTSARFIQSRLNSE